LTDFGDRDWFVASMKGAILSIHPEARIVDLSHQIAPHRIDEARYFLKSCYREFPDGTIHVVVVDPGVDDVPFGEFGEVGVVVPVPGVDCVPGFCVDVPGVAVLGFGVAAPGLGVAVPGVGEAAPAFGVAAPAFGVAVPGFVAVPPAVPVVP